MREVNKIGGFYRIVSFLVFSCLKSVFLAQKRIKQPSYKKNGKNKQDPREDRENEQDFTTATRTQYE